MMEVMGDEARVDLDLAASIASTASLAPSLQQAKSLLSSPASATAPPITLDLTYFALVQKAKDLGTENHALQAEVISLKADCDVYFVIAKEMEQELHEARENGPKQLALKHQEQLTALESKAATDADIAAAKLKAAEAMIASLKLELTFKLPAHSFDTASRLPTELPVPQPGMLVIEPVTDIGPSHFNKLAQTIEDNSLAANMAFTTPKRLTLQIQDLRDHCMQNLNHVQPEPLLLIESISCKRKTAVWEAEIVALKQKVWEYEALEASKQRARSEEEAVAKKETEETTLALAEEADGLQDDVNFLAEHLEMQASVLAQEERDIGKLNAMLMDYMTQRAKHSLHDPAGDNFQKSVAHETYYAD